MRNSIRRILILTLLCLYTVFKATQIWTTQVGLVAALTMLFFFIMIGWLFIYHAKPTLVDNIWFRSFVWIGSFVMGLWATFILLSIPIDVGFLLWKIFHPEKITTLAREVNLIILAIAMLIALLGFLEVWWGPRIKKISIPIIDLPPALHNLRIVHLSDLHIGPTIRKNYIEKVVLRSNKLKPDIIVVTGDIADAKADDIAPALQPLANLTATYGTFYVTGNHEYYWDPLGLIAKVKSLGFTVLVNENRIININDTKVLIAGVPDVIGGKFIASHHPDVEKAIQATETTSLKMLLAHRPEVCIEAEKVGFDLQFSGHTHGGQFFPFNILVALVHEYYRRLNKHGRLWLHVNPGTGYWGPANRFGVPAEITLLTLKPA